MFLCAPKLRIAAAPERNATAHLAVWFRSVQEEAITEFIDVWVMLWARAQRSRNSFLKPHTCS